MNLRTIQEASLIQANYLLNQEKNKKGLKNIQPEIDKLSEIFGIEFDKSLYCLLFDEIDFKDMKMLINTKNVRVQFFLQQFQNDIEKEGFVNFFAEILMKSRNSNSVNEIMEGLQKVIKLTNENQLKILLSFALSKNQNFVNDAYYYLVMKCKEIQNENKFDQINPSLSQDIILLLSRKNISITLPKEAKNQGGVGVGDCTNLIDEIFFLNFRTTNDNFAENESPISNLENLLELAEEDESDEDEKIPMEKLYEDLGPLIINKNISIPKDHPLVDDSMNAKRIADFILNIIKKGSFNEDKETKIMNKVFLRSLGLENELKNIDENTDKQQVEWNVDNFYKMYKNQIESIDPKEVFDHLDSPLFVVKDKKKLDCFMNALKSLNLIKNNNYNQFFDFIFKKWENEENQIDFLQYLVANPQSENFSFKNYKGKRINKHYEYNSSITNSSKPYLLEPWTCISLLEVLLKLSHGCFYIKVKELFDWPIQNIPEIIALGLMQIVQSPTDFLYDELIQEVLTLFLGNHMNSFTVIEEVWNANKELVINAIANMYNSSPDLMNLSRILDITQKLKDSLLLLVDCNDYKFAVNLAILAVKRDFLHIEQWLKERIANAGDDFIIALVDYIKENLITHCKNNPKSKENILEKSQLTLESLAVILENLILAKHSNNPKISLSTEEEIQEIYKNIFETFKELNLEPPNSKEIEDTANSIFQSMFKGETKVEETIEKLKHLKDSKQQKDREIYACMIHCLLDEYRFYHQYPEKQLTIVSTLFGKIINNKLIDGVIETIALKYILEGIRKGNGPLFIFGTTALQQFIDKLNLLPSYTKSLIETKQLKNDPILFESVYEKYTSIYTNDPATNSLLQVNGNQNINPNALNGTNMPNLMGQQNLNMGINSNMNVNPNIANLGLGQNSPLAGMPSPISPPLYSQNNPNTPGGGNIFENDLQQVNNLMMKNNQQRVNVNVNVNQNQTDNNAFNPLMYNVPQNTKSPNATDQIFGLNGLGNNLNTNLPLNTQILPPNTNLMNNSLPNLGFVSAQGGMDTNNIFNSSNLNNNNNLSNLQNSSNLNNSMTSLSSQNAQVNSNILSNSTAANLLPSNLSNLNDSMGMSSSNLDNESKSPQKRAKVKRQPSNNNLPTDFSGMNLNNMNIMGGGLVGNNINNNNNGILGPNNNQNNINNINNNINNINVLNNNNNSNNNNSNIMTNNNSNNCNNLVELFSGDQEHKIQPANPDIIDQVNFIFNQLCENNMAEKAKELNKLFLTTENNLNENTLRWFSDYFIVNRICTEMNNHKKYFELINLINIKDLINYQIRDTIYYIRKLLKTKNLEDQKEKSFLKFLGNWLGLITLSRNKPILAKDLDFRELLSNGFENGKLYVYIPFICKILEHSVKTKVFHIKNPWLQSVLSIINEIYGMPGIITNIKFEIERIFKVLGINEFTNNYPRSSFLENKIMNKNSPDFKINSNNMNNNSMNMNLGGMNLNNNGINNNVNMNNSGNNNGTNNNNGFNPYGNMQANNNGLGNNSSKILSVLQGDNKNIPGGNINNSIGNNNGMNLNMNLNNSQGNINQEEQQSIKKEFFTKILQCGSYLAEMNKIFESNNIYLNGYIDKNETVSLITKVLNKSIYNIISPVIERAVNISLVTTKELVIKDFQFEPNEKKFKVAAINSMKSLAGALALVTCKEPLRMSYNKKMKDFLAERHIDENTIDEVLKIRSTGDLLNIGCTYIYNYVQKQAATAVLQDEAIQKEIERRTKNDGKSMFCSESTNPSLMKIVSKLPDLLKPDRNGLTKEQLDIYDYYPKIYGEFINMESNKMSSNNSNNVAYTSNTIIQIRHVLKEVIDKPNNSITKLVRSYEFAMQNIQTLMKNHLSNSNINNTSSNEFEEDSEELKMLEKCIIDNRLKELNFQENEEIKIITQLALSTYRFVYFAFEHQYTKLLNVYLTFIKGWIKLYPNVIQKEITNKVMQSSITRFNLNLHVELIKRHIICLEDYQDFILNFLEQPIMQKLSINLLNGLKKKGIFCPSSSSSNNPNTNTNPFPKIAPFMLVESSCHKYFSLFGKNCKLPANLNINTQQVIDYKICNIKDIKTYQLFGRMCYFAFNKIIATRYPAEPLEYDELVKRLSNFITSPFISNDEQLNVFIMLITETCVKSTFSTTENYPDNQAKCIYTLLTAVPKNMNKLKMFGNILNGIFKTFHYDYVKTNLNFNQRPYYKLFYYFIELLSDFPNDAKILKSENTKMQYMNLIAEFFKIPAPSNYPGFSLAWLDLISCRPFVNSFLCDVDNPSKNKNIQTLEHYLHLIIDLFLLFKNNSNHNLHEFTSKIFMDNFYKFMFLLCNSYPEFVSGYHYMLLISLPLENTFMQLKNLILSTTPRSIYKTGINYNNFEEKDLTQELLSGNLDNNKGEVFFNICDILKQYQFISLLDQYLETKKDELVREIYTKLNMNKNRTFNFYVMNGMAIYFAEKSIKNKEIINNNKEVYDFFLKIIKYMDNDNRENLINSFLNGLRYPSNQTLFFVLLILHILSEVKDENIEEHIILLLIERLLIKPIPWGVELLYHKLLREEKYKLFSKDFLRNLNDGFEFFRSIKNFIMDKNATKYSVYKYLGGYSGNKNNISGIGGSTIIDSMSAEGNNSDGKDKKDKGMKGSINENDINKGK